MSDTSITPSSAGEALGRGLLGGAYRTAGPDDEEYRVHKYLANVGLADDFRDTFETLSRLQDDGLARYYSLETPEDGPVCIETEFIAGDDLVTWVRRSGGDRPDDAGAVSPSDGGADWSQHTESGGDDQRPGGAPDREVAAYLDRVFARIRQVVPQIAGSLERLHRFDHAHGNLKPSNAIVTPDGRCALTDYGVIAHARLRDGSIEDDPDLALFDAYRAPELDRGDRPTPASDRYALGCLLFELITGCRPPALERNPSDSAPHPLAGRALSKLAPRCPAVWVDLVTRLIDQDPGERPSLEAVAATLREAHAQPVSIPPSFVPEGETFHGRDEVYDSLVAAGQRCADRGELHVQLVTGGPGYGKSALVRSFSQWAGEHGWVVLTGECLGAPARVYEPWRDVARQLAELIEESGDELRRELARHRRLASVLFPVLSTDSTPPEDVSRREAVAGLRRLLERLASERPLLIWLDDLQWADRDSVRLLADLTARPARLQSLVVGTWRPSEETPGTRAYREEMRTSPAVVRQLEVRKFTTDEAESFLDTIAEQLTPAQRHWVLERGHRNPLILQELAYELHLRAPDADRGEPPPGDLYAPDQGPARILRSLIETRLERVSRREYFVVELMSVAALPLSEGTLVHALDEEFRGRTTEGHFAGDLLHRLRRLRLLSETDGAEGGETTFRLFHDICRELVLDEMPPQRRRHLSGLIAGAVRVQTPQTPVVTFEFLRHSDASPGEYAPFGLRAARRAEQRRSYDRAADLWENLAEEPEARERLTTADPGRSLADAERFAGRPARACRRYRELAEDRPPGLQGTKLHWMAFECALEAGLRSSALEAAEDALSHFAERYDAANFVTRFSEYKNRLVAATNRWAENLDAASDATPDREDVLRASLYRSIVFNNDILDSSRGARFRAKLSALAETSNRSLLLGWERLFRARRSHRGWLLQHDERAMEWYDEADALFERSETPAGTTVLACERSNLHRKAGRFEEAERVLDRAPAPGGLGRAEARRTSFLPELARARLEFERANFDAARARAIEVLHLHRDHALAGFRARRLLTPIALLRAEFDEAERHLEACERLVRGSEPSEARVWTVRQRVRWNLGLGRPDVAVGRVEVLDAHLNRSLLARNPGLRAMLELSRAQALTAEIHRDRSLDHTSPGPSGGDVKFSLGRLRDVVDSLAPAHRAECYRTFARWELLRGRPDRAMDELDGAVSAVRNYPSPLARTLCAEAMGAVQQSREADDSPSLLEQSQLVREHWGCPSPLALEGWPVSDELSALRPEQA